MRPADVEHLLGLIADWTVLADLGFSDLVLWLPTWNEGGLVAGAQIRPTTSPTTLGDDVVGDFVPRGRRPVLDRALAQRRLITERTDASPVPVGEEAIPVVREGRAIAVLGRSYGGAARPTGQLERQYLEAADDLAVMVAEGNFPPPAVLALAGRSPRVGDGLVRVDPAGRVEYATPNAVSAFHRLGLAVDLLGRDLASLTTRLTRRPGPVDEALALVAAGSAAGGVDVENSNGTVALRSIPLLAGGTRRGALILVRDVTDLRRSDRALLTKDATIREIHHRVKNNLQTVAALLRLQSRRMDSTQAAQALAEAEARVRTIAVVHETLSRSEGESVEFDEVLARIANLIRDLSPGVQVSLAEVGEVSADVVTPLALVLTELLANAAEHGGPQVRLAARRSGTPEWLDFAVIDSGAAESNSADWDLSGEEPEWARAGTGLGLQIVRTLVGSELAGRIDFRSDVAGTRALISVPTLSPVEPGPAGSDA